MTENFKRTYFLFIFALVFYVTGAAFVESFVNYPTWKLIGANEFKTYHNALSPLIIKFMVAPWLIETELTVTLFWLRPRVIPLWMVTVCLVLNLIVWASSALIQIPIQFELGEKGLSHSAIDKLIATDPIRWVSGSIRSLLYLWMIPRFVRTTDINV
jgi:hypothetical protein